MTLMKEVPRSISIDCHKYPFSQIDLLIKASIYGKMLKENKPRWDHFRPEKTSIEVWQKILGNDTDPLNHMVLTRGITRYFLRHQEKDNGAVQFTPEEESILLFTASVHDFQEAIKKDIPFPLKTEKTDADERELLTTLLSSLFDTTPKNVEVVAKVLGDKKSKLDKAWYVIEELGYQRTGNLAYLKSLKLEDSKERFTNENVLPLISSLKLMAFCMLQADLRRLIPLSDDYPAVSDFLSNSAAIITHAFSFINDQEAYGAYQKLYKKSVDRYGLDVLENYLQAKKEWQERKDKLHPPLI
jgi:hypothetical protein